MPCRANETKAATKRHENEAERYAEAFSIKRAHLIMRVIVIDGRDQTCIIVRARAVRTYVYIIINAHARTKTREQNGTRSKRPAHAVHGTKTSTFY